MSESALVDMIDVIHPWVFDCLFAVAYIYILYVYIYILRIYIYIYYVYEYL